MNFKKLLLPLIAAVLLFAGCSKDHGTRIYTTYYTIEHYEWAANANLGYYYVECSNPNITTDVIDGGAVMAYYLDNNGFDNQLPYLLPYYDNDKLYFENVRYDVSTGKITFIIQESDLTTNLNIQNQMKFKVCVMKNMDY